MKSIFSGASGDSFFLIFVRVITLVLGILITRVLSGHFSLQEYGTYSQVMLLITTISSMITFGLMDGINYYFCREVEKERRDSYVSTIFGLQYIIGAFVFFVINDKVFICNESEININATVGAAKITETLGLSALYNADMALKKAKQMRKHYLLYDETMEIAKEYENNIKWTYILKDAIAKDSIIPFFQPIVNNKTGDIEKYECLCRLISNNNDIISPYYFLDIAKKIRLYPNITRRILIKSFEKFADCVEHRSGGCLDRHRQCESKTEKYASRQRRMIISHPAACS